jgi:hypothetical protein
MLLGKTEVLPSDTSTVRNPNKKQKINYSLKNRHKKNVFNRVRWGIEYMPKFTLNEAITENICIKYSVEVEIGKAILFRVETFRGGRCVSSVEYMLPKSQISISGNKITIADWIWEKRHNCLSFNKTSDKMSIEAAGKGEA